MFVILNHPSSHLYFRDLVFAKSRGFSQPHSSRNFVSETSSLRLSRINLHFSPAEASCFNRDQIRSSKITIVAIFQEYSPGGQSSRARAREREKKSTVCIMFEEVDCIPKIRRDRFTLRSRSLHFAIYANSDIAIAVPKEIALIIGSRVNFESK